MLDKYKLLNMSSSENKDIIIIIIIIRTSRNQYVPHFFKVGGIKTVGNLILKLSKALIRFILDRGMGCVIVSSKSRKSLLTGYVTSLLMPHTTLQARLYNAPV